MAFHINEKIISSFLHRYADATILSGETGIFGLDQSY